MTSDNKTARPGADYSQTLYLPKTDFPMRAGLPALEPKLAAYWQEIGLYRLLRKSAAKREAFVLHDGPPYANGHIHIGHALNKVLKDILCRSQQMQGKNANYVPGWDCHGLPIEWKVEEQYRARGKNKDAVPVNEFRRECREFADKWIKTQAEEFQRLGVAGDFANPYKTMNYDSEARIAEELMKFAASGQLYRGSKPVMWSVVERTALAEAEIEYHELESEAIWVKFPVAASQAADLRGAFAVIWTTTPWTIPANRAVCFAPDAAYGLYQVTGAENPFGPQKGEHLLFADAQAAACGQKAKLKLKRVRAVAAAELAAVTLAHPLKGAFPQARDKNGAEAYSFPVPLLAGSHVTDDAGTGFVHTAPSHGREDFDAWNAARPQLEARGISAEIPFPVDDGGYYTADAPGLDGEIDGRRARVLDDKGKEGGANKAVIAALIKQDKLFARGRIKHAYPHSWRSKKPVIFRNTPQWFIAMDKELPGGGTLRARALAAVDKTRFVPEGGKNRLRAMIETRPDWVLSRQRVWGVPIAVFANEKGEILHDEAVNKRILAAFREEGADAWFAEGARERFLGAKLARQDWRQVGDILDVWFDSGCTHVFTLEARADKKQFPNGTNLQWPADIYLEGSDQHRGWFQSSLLEACGARGRAPFKAIVTHGFTLDGNGRKMSKSLGNTVSPQEIIQKYGADILRLWVAGTDYWDDQRLSQDSIQTAVDSYRKLRNVIRWILGTLSALQELPQIQQGLQDARLDADIAKLREFAQSPQAAEPYSDIAPELERYMMAELAALETRICAAYAAFDFKRAVRLLLDFANLDLSAFYFDIRKDALYCDAPSSRRRLAALFAIQAIFERFITWAAPVLPFTAEEAWREYRKIKPDNAVSVHLEQFRPAFPAWRGAPAEKGGKVSAIADKWEAIRRVRRAVTGALEEARREKHIGSSLEAGVEVYVSDMKLYHAARGDRHNIKTVQDGEGKYSARLEMADICITSGFALYYCGKEGNIAALKKSGVYKTPPQGAFTSAEAPGVFVSWRKADGEKCARSWRRTQDVGQDAEFPDVSARDAAALREKRKLGLI